MGGNNARTRTVCLAVFFLLLSVSGVAQSRTKPAAIAVTGAIPRASVILNGIRLGRVEEDGAKTFGNLPPGRYTLVVRQPGFADFRVAVALTAGRTASIKPTLVASKDRAEVAFQQAEALALDGKHTEAAALFAKAIAERDGRYPEARIGLARSLTVLKRTDEANQNIQLVLASNPRDLEAKTVGANVLRESGLYEDAVTEYRKAIAIAPDQAPEAHTGLAILLSDRGDYAEAVDEFRKAIAQNLDAEPLLYQLLGNTLEHLEQPDQAIAAYARFLELAPKHSLAPAVRSVVERLKLEASEGSPDDEDEVNPYAPPR